MPNEACCLSISECRELTYEACREIGGLPMGIGRTCGIYTGPDGAGIGSCSFEACCWRVSGVPVCDDMPAAACDQNTGGVPMGRGVLCQPIETAGGCFQAAIGFDCCLPDGSKLPAFPQVYCDALRGTSVFPGEPCPPPPTNDECRLPSDVSIPGGPSHTLELCAQTPLLPEIVPAGTEGHRPGYGILVSVRGVRNDHRARSCEAAGTTVFLDARGYGSPTFCSRQPRFPSPDDAFRAHDGAVVLQRSDDPDPVTKPGYGMAVAAYDAPDWSEVILGSILQRCWGPPI